MAIITVFKYSEISFKVPKSHLSDAPRICSLYLLLHFNITNGQEKPNFIIRNCAYSALANKRPLLADGMEGHRYHCCYTNGFGGHNHRICNKERNR